MMYRCGCAVWRGFQVEKQTILLREAETKAQENADAAAEAQAAVRDELVRVTAERNRLQSELSSVAETNDALESESRDAGVCVRVLCGWVLCLSICVAVSVWW